MPDLPHSSLRVIVFTILDVIDIGVKPSFKPTFEIAFKRDFGACGGEPKTGLEDFNQFFTLQT